MESLYRSAGGDLLRVPTGLSYPNAGKLWRGNEICCPAWEIAHYCQHCPVEYTSKSSIYTPKYMTLESVAGVLDCPAPWGMGMAAPTNALTDIVLTQMLGTQDGECMWRGFQQVCADWSDPNELCLAVQLMQLTGPAWHIAIWKYTPIVHWCSLVADVAGTVRDGAVNQASDLGVGDCGDNYVTDYGGPIPSPRPGVITCHGGTFTLSTGDTT